ncbi:cytochrome c biogenesis protein ResB [Aquibacillus sediminis]|uniref:cytochrome c biogenesis protein ResB n=1 Tax=Aquibacillus sediminis TaxID=2574734 RepID=UPI0011086D9B|nr:cytochrome c biogenesis protein ResB [Aquibacillus sediminis]
MKRIVCEACGHSNAEGTVLCQSCGKPIEKNQHIDGNEKTKLLNMRYDGSARRSQTYNKSFVDKIWNFFSSVKVGVWLIVLTLLASALGTIFPQEMYIPQDVQPLDHYREQYGIAGQIYYQLGLHNLYSSWWYMILIALIGISIVVASIDRVVPLYKALKMQKPKRHETFLKRQRLFSQTNQPSLNDKEKFLERLKSKRYKLTEEDGHILAEKGRFTRWGPYVNHLGLIIFLIGALLRFVPFMYIDEFVWVREGETLPIKGTEREYYIENNDFIFETYDEEEDRKFAEALQNQSAPVASNYQTDAVIYRNHEAELVGAEPDLEKVKEGSIRVNHPLKIDGFSLYQSSYQSEFSTMSFYIHETDDKDEQELANFTVDLSNPVNHYELDNGFEVELVRYMPDYYLDDGEPKSKTDYPNNPAFVFAVYPPDASEPEYSFAGIGRNIDATGENDYKIALNGFDVQYVTGLAVKRDYTLPILMIGGLIFMIGVVQGLYWQHRRIWIHPKGNELWVAAHTNKNWYGLKREIDTLMEDTSLIRVVDQQEQK